MTFSLVGMCRRTGMIGAAVTTSSMGVGSRCPFARAGVGAVLTQHRTDPQLGPRGLELLAAGQSAGQVIASLATDNSTIGWRQLAVLDQRGDNRLLPWRPDPIHSRRRPGRRRVRHRQYYPP